MAKHSKVAASLASCTMEACLLELANLDPRICAAEVRLDLMDAGEVSIPSVRHLVASSLVPLVVTFRPTWEGGSYDGDEGERLNILRAAADAGAAYVDIEADIIELANDWSQYPATKIIASKHWYDEMPSDLLPAYNELRNKADVVKFVGTATTFSDIVPVLRLLRAATSPVISLAMGEAGRLTRMIAPAFPHCEMTYGSLSDDTATAPGQVTVLDMLDIYGLAELNAAEALHISLGKIVEGRPSIELSADQIDEAVELLRFELPSAVVDVVS